jgi:hypothetical protein
MTASNNDKKCKNPQLPENIAKEIEDYLDNLKRPDEFQNEFESLLESLEQTISLLLKELDNLMDAENVDCEAEVRYKQLLKQLQEEFKLYEALYEYLQSHEEIVILLLEKVNNESEDGDIMSKTSMMEKLKENVRKYTEHGKYKQILKDKTYMYKYNTHYGYALGLGVITMIGFTVYSAYKK